MKKVRSYGHTVTVGFKGIVNSRDESVVDAGYAKSANGFLFDKGVLTGQFGIDLAYKPCEDENGEKVPFEPLPAGRKYKALFLFRRSGETEEGEELVAQLDDGSLYHTPLFEKGGWVSYDMKREGEIEGVTMVFNGKPALLIASESRDLAVIYAEAQYVNSSAPHFSTIEAYNERLFGGVNGTECKLWFSQDFDPMNWKVDPKDAGYITFNDGMGRIVKCIAMHGYLYVFRDYGICRLSAYGIQSEFSLKRMINDTGRIYKRTIVLCGGNIIYLSEKGLYSFDGYDVKQIGKEFPELVSDGNICAAYLNGVYFLACSKTSKVNDTLIRYELGENSFSVLEGVNVTSFFTLATTKGSHIYALLEREGEVSLCTISKSGKVLGQPTPKTYESPIVNDGVSAVKTVRSASFTTRYPLTFGVVLDGKKYEFPLNGSEKTQTVYVDRSARKISFTLSTDEADAFVTPIEVKFDYHGISEGL